LDLGCGLVQGEHEVDYLFLSQSLSGQALPLDPNPNEVAEVKYVTPDELRHMMRCVGSKRTRLICFTVKKCEVVCFDPRPSFLVISVKPGVDREADKHRGTAHHDDAASVVRLTPWSRAIMEKFLFVWWQDLANLSRHMNDPNIHRLGRVL
jgi:isopentenyldiphosphate isomerase